MHNKQSLNITLLEPSQIIFEGISNLLSKSGHYFNLFKIDSIDELDNLSGKDKPDIVIINPGHIQNKTKEFAAVKKKHPDVCWIGMVYSLFDKQLLSLFDKTFSITDSPEIIIDLIGKLTQSEPSGGLPALQEHLSERETEVLKLIVSGFSNKEIADKLFISIHTVVSHRKNISQKTGIKSQSGLTIYAISNKIIFLDDYSN